MRIRPIYVAPKPKEYAVNRQYLKDASFFQMTAFRESIAETLSTVSKAKARSATLWGRVEELSTFENIDKKLEFARRERDS